MRTDMNRARGFSMIELMIVLVIISILAAIAIPSYRQYMLKGHRSEATRALQDIASRQENYYFSNNEYADNLGDLGATSSIAGSYYTIAIASASSTDYEITAAARGTQTQDGACTAFALHRSGAKGSSGSGATEICWGGH
jgi:type IV pilus assembly protein PilE